MRPLPRGILLGVLALALAGGGWLSIAAPPSTLAFFGDVEGGAGFMKFTGNVPIATCAVFWANSQTSKDTLKITGSDHVFRGCLHSNNDFALGGSRNTFDRTVRHVTTYTNNSNGHVLKKGSIQVAAEPYPFPYDLAKYAPGGCRAEQALAAGAYWQHVGSNVQIKGGPLKEGLHFITGSASVDLTSFPWRRTWRGR